MTSLNDKLARARALSWKHFGRKITFYLPGMFRLDGQTGAYRALSITGRRCELRCDHCRGRILETMEAPDTPDDLVSICRRLARTDQGVLISGGCDRRGRLPWPEFIPAIRRIKAETGLYVSVHSGLLDEATARDLKAAGVDQALIDVIGDDETFQKIYHVPFGISVIADTLRALDRAGLPMVPHVVCGLDYGRIRGERRALDMIARHRVEQVVIVSLMRIPGTPAWSASPPAPEEVAEILAEARLKMPETRISLGCARMRGSGKLEMLAIEAGVNRMALPSDEALEKAREYGLTIRYQRTCCSVSMDTSGESWLGPPEGVIIRD